MFDLIYLIFSVIFILLIIFIYTNHFIVFLYLYGLNGVNPWWKHLKTHGMPWVNHVKPLDFRFLLLFIFLLSFYGFVFLINFICFIRLIVIAPIVGNIIKIMWMCRVD